MQKELSMVRDFMKKHRSPIAVRLPSCRNVCLETIHGPITITATILEGRIFEGDPRVLRAHLLCEELSEVIGALMGGNRRDLLDGLADLLYVTLGTAITFDLPLAAAFDEVHRSNMTKNAALALGDPRVGIKGSDYKPPNLDGL